jgi:hypothetical protein
MICADEGRASRITVGTPNRTIVVEPASAVAGSGLETIEI